MRLILCIFFVWGTMPAAESPYRIDAVASVATYHFHRNGQNEINPGVGLRAGLNEGAWTPSVGALVYDDSASNTAWMAGAGIRYDISPYVAAQLGVGYAHFTAYHGVAFVPTILAGSERVKAGVSLIGLRALGLTLEYRL